MQFPVYTAACRTLFGSGGFALGQNKSPRLHGQAVSQLPYQMGMLAFETAPLVKRQYVLPTIDIQRTPVRIDAHAQSVLCLSYPQRYFKMITQKAELTEQLGHRVVKIGGNRFDRNVYRIGIGLPPCHRLGSPPGVSLFLEF